MHDDDKHQQQKHQQQAYHHHQQSNESLDADLRLESKVATELIDSSILILLRERWENLRVYRIKLHVALLIFAAPQALLWGLLPPSPDWTLNRLFSFAIASIFINGILLAACQLATYEQRVQVDILLTLGYASTVIFNCIYCITSYSYDSNETGFSMRMDQRTVLLMCLYIYVYPIEVGIPYRMQSIAFPILTLSMFFAMSPRNISSISTDTLLFEITALAIITCVFSVVTFLPQRFVYFLERSQKALLQTLAIESRAQIVLLKRVIPDVFFEQLFSPAKMAISEPIPNVTVLFCEVMVTSFDSAGVARKPEKLGSNLQSSSLTLLSAVFETLEKVVEQYGIFKVETIFSEFMAVSGLPAKHMHHKNTAYAMVVAALEMIREVKKEFGKGGPSSELTAGIHVDLQIGINTGPVVEGILGRKLLPRWKLFGDTVNTASRMKSTGVFGRINLSRSTRNHIMTDALAISTSALGLEIPINGINSSGSTSANSSSLLRQLTSEIEANEKFKRDLHLQTVDNDQTSEDEEATEPISNLDILFGRCVGFFLRQRPPMIIKGKGVRCTYLVELCITDTLSPSMERLREKAVIGLLPHSSFRKEVQALSKIEEIREVGSDQDCEKEVVEADAELLEELRSFTAISMSEAVRAEHSESFGQSESQYPCFIFHNDLSSLSPDARRWFSMHDEVWAKHGLQQMLNGIFRSSCPFLWDGEGSLLSTASHLQKRHTSRARPTTGVSSEHTNVSHASISPSIVQNVDDTFIVDASMSPSSQTRMITPRYAEELLSATIMAAQQLKEQQLHQNEHQLKQKLRTSRQIVREREKTRRPLTTSLTVSVENSKHIVSSQPILSPTFGLGSIAAVTASVGIGTETSATSYKVPTTNKRLSRSFHRLAVSAGGSLRGSQQLSRMLESPLATVPEDIQMSSPNTFTEVADQFSSTHLTAGDDNVAVPMLDPWSLTFTREQANLEEIFVAEHIDRFSRKSLILVFLLLVFVQFNSHILLQNFYGSNVAYALTCLSVLSVSSLLIKILFYLPNAKGLEETVPLSEHTTKLHSWQRFGLSLRSRQRIYAHTVIFVLALLVLNLSLILAKVSGIPSFEYHLVSTQPFLNSTSMDESQPVVSSISLSHDYVALYVISCFQLVLLAPFYFGVIFKHHTLLVVGAQVLCVPFVIICGAEEGSSGAIWLAMMLLSSVRSVWRVELRLRGTFLDKLLVAEHKLRTKQMLLAMLPYSIAEEMMRRSGMEVLDDINNKTSNFGSCTRMKQRVTECHVFLFETFPAFLKSFVTFLFNTIGRWIWMNMCGFEFTSTDEVTVFRRQSAVALADKLQGSLQSPVTKKILIKRGSRIMPEPLSISSPLSKSPSSSLPLVSGATIEVSLLMVDLVGFTSLSADVGPSVIVELLDELYSSFDRIIARRGARKIETIGDAMLVSCGAPEPSPASESAPRIAKCALDMLSAVQAFSHRFEDRLCGHTLHARVGIHTGKVLGGVIGSQLPRYQLFGSAVDEVQLMESSSEPGKVRASPQILAYLTANIDISKLSAQKEVEKASFCGNCCHQQRVRKSLLQSPKSQQRAVPDMKCVRILPDGSGFIERDRAGGLESGVQW